MNLAGTPPSLDTENRWYRSSPPESRSNARVAPSLAQAAPPTGASANVSCTGHPPYVGTFQTWLRPVTSDRYATHSWLGEKPIAECDRRWTNWSTGYATTPGRTALTTESSTLAPAPVRSRPVHATRVTTANP